MSSASELESSTKNATMLVLSVAIVIGTHIFLAKPVDFLEALPKDTGLLLQDSHDASFSDSDSDLGSRTHLRSLSSTLTQTALSKVTLPESTLPKAASHRDNTKRTPSQRVSQSSNKRLSTDSSSFIDTFEGTFDKTWDGTIDETFDEKVTFSKAKSENLAKFYTFMVPLAPDAQWLNAGLWADSASSLSSSTSLKASSNGAAHSKDVSHSIRIFQEIEQAEIIEADFEARSFIKELLSVRNTAGEISCPGGISTDFAAKTGTRFVGCSDFDLDFETKPEAKPRIKPGTKTGAYIDSASESSFESGLLPARLNQDLAQEETEDDQAANFQSGGETKLESVNEESSATLSLEKEPHDEPFDEPLDEFFGEPFDEPYDESQDNPVTQGSQGQNAGECYFQVRLLSAGLPLEVRFMLWEWVLNTRLQALVPFWGPIFISLFVFYMDGILTARIIRRNVKTPNPLRFKLALIGLVLTPVIPLGIFFGLWIKEEVWLVCFLFGMLIFIVALRSFVKAWPSFKPPL